MKLIELIECSILQHPVYCLGMVGTQNAHNVISISSDGKLCSWSLDMLSVPQEILELQYKYAVKPAAFEWLFIIDTKIQ